MEASTSSTSIPPDVAERIAADDEEAAMLLVLDGLSRIADALGDGFDRDVSSIEIVFPATDSMGRDQLAAQLHVVSRMLAASIPEPSQPGRDIAWALRRLAVTRPK